MRNCTSSSTTAELYFSLRLPSDLLREFVLRMASHNVLSLRQPEAIELVISYMIKHRIAVYGAQETWLSGFFIKTNKGYIIINNNKDDAHRRGVAIVLAPAAVAAWDRTGRALCKPCDRVLAIRLTYTDRAGKDKRPKDDRKTQHLEGRAYAVKFRDDEAASDV